MTIVDLLLYIREQFLDARSKKDKGTLRHIWQTIDVIVEVAYNTGDRPVAGILEDIGASIRDSLIDEEWKSSIPTEEQIKAIGLIVSK